MQAITVREHASAPIVQPNVGRTIFFVVETDRSGLADLAERVEDGRLKPIVGAVNGLRRRRLRSRRTAAFRERRSSGSSKADSRLQIAPFDGPLCGRHCTHVRAAGRAARRSGGSAVPHAAQMP